MIAALFVESQGIYSNLGLDLWDIQRDARKYRGKLPVIAHPPCERWGRYWSGGPSAKERRMLGDDEGCFFHALWAVRQFGGVLEHPEASHAFKFFGLCKPNRLGGWTGPDSYGGYVCQVEQGHYGHRARKATWLYAVNTKKPELIWGPSTGERLDEGFHSKEERMKARASGQKPIKRLSKAENISTPIKFRDTLISMVMP